MNEIVLAADLGGTNLRIAAVNREGRILHCSRSDTPSTGGANEIVRSILNAVKDCREAGGSDGPIRTVSLALAATVNSADGIVFRSPNLPALNGLHLAETLSKEIGLRVILENDANAAAMGENWLGASKDIDSSICVTIGTGIGGGIILGGGIYRGVDGTAGEIGHICVEPAGEPCGCGSWGCVEQYASATAIVRMTRELENQYPQSLLLNKPGLTSLEVYEAGKSGDRLALEAFRLMGFYLGIGLAGLVNVLNPEMIVIGGGASAGWDLFIDHVREQIQKRAFREPADRATLVRARLGDDAGIMGAARLAFLAET